MAKEWPILANPPVVVALFQLKFEMGNTKLSDFLKFDTQLRSDFPHRNDNIEASIDLPSSPIPLGVSKVTGTSNAKMARHVYFSSDQKCKLTITDGSLTYTDERKYVGWNEFERLVCKYLTLFSPILAKHIITRTSIRFINLFTFDSFNDPTVYFKTLVSTTSENALPFPVMKYSFKLMLDVKENIYSIVNQNLDKAPDKFIYLFDIDVLNKSNLIFDINSIKETLAELRGIKNDVFFGNITSKIIELCN